MLELLIVAVVLGHAAKSVISESAYAVRGKTSPRMKLKRDKLRATIDAGRPVRFGATGYFADVWDDSWEKTRAKRAARRDAKAGDATVWDHRYTTAYAKHLERMAKRHAKKDQKTSDDSTAGDPVDAAFDDTPRDDTTADEEFERTHWTPFADPNRSLSDQAADAANSREPSVPQPPSTLAGDANNAPSETDNEKAARIAIGKSIETNVARLRESRPGDEDQVRALRAFQAQGWAEACEHIKARFPDDWGPRIAEVANRGVDPHLFNLQFTSKSTDPPASETVAPIPEETTTTKENQMNATPTLGTTGGETNTLGTLVNWLRRNGKAARAVSAQAEQATAAASNSEVGQESLELLQRVQITAAEFASILEHADERFSAHLAVTDAYLANRSAGNKQYVTAD